MLTCAPNFRDIGGATAVDGRHVQPGLVYRSEALLEPGVGDLATLERIGVRTVLDVRSERERERTPGFWPGQSVSIHHVDVNADPRARATSLTTLQQDPTPRGARNFMLEVYARLPSACAGAVLRLFASIADGELPLVVHCTAGKDRTGFLISTLLTTLGVPRKQVLTDYMATADRLSPDTVAASRFAIDGRLDMPLSDAALREILAVHPDYLTASAIAIAEMHGSVAAYLEWAGIDAETLAAVRERLLV